MFTTLLLLLPLALALPQAAVTGATTTATEPVKETPTQHAVGTHTTTPVPWTPPKWSNTTLHPHDHNGQIVSSKCLDVRNGEFKDGALVQIYDCNGTPAQDWSVALDKSTQVRLAGTDYCLDSTDAEPDNGTQMKIWKCYDGLDAQRWWFTNDGYLALQDRGRCLDLTDGKLDNWNVMQIWECGDKNNNQKWYPGVLLPRPVPA